MKKKIRLSAETKYFTFAEPPNQLAVREVARFDLIDVHPDAELFEMYGATDSLPSGPLAA